MIKLSANGKFNKTYKFLNKIRKVKVERTLDKYGRLGVEVLSAATPVDTGLTASSWDYEISRNQNENTITITWTNSNVHKGINIAMLLQLGHGTRNGGWVEGRDYITPAIRPIFDDILESAKKEIIEG